MEDGAIEEEIGRLLVGKHLTLAVAESCTGGLLGHRLTQVSGSSSYFLGGIIAYANDVKTRDLGVEPDVLAREGAVSADVAGQMARGVRERMAADVGVGITGIAGPGGGTESKPVGLVFIAVADASTCLVRRCLFEGCRARIKMESSGAALVLLKQFLKEEGVRNGQEERG